MTRAGQVLVFVNLFVSVALVTWAVSLTTNRLDWVDRQDGAQKIEGEVTKLRKEIDAAIRGINEVSGVYGQKEQALVDAEAGSDPGREGRDVRRAVFAKRLTDAKSGRFAEQRQLPGKVLIDVNREGNPILGPNGENLEGVDVYNGRLDRAVVESRRLNEQIAGQRKQFDDLSKQIEDANLRIDAQRVIAANLADEQQYLKAVQVNWDEELRTLQTRQKQLERRIKAFTDPKGS